jgi:D-cysteine desulfhydrase
MGMRTALVLVPQPETEHVRAQLERLRASGAELHLVRGVLSAYLMGAWLMAARAGWPPRPPYPLPPGGSTPLGCVGYVQAAFELSDQIAAGELPEPSHVVVALGTGGTAAGLLAGLRLAEVGSRLACVLVTDIVRIDERTVSRLASRTLRLLKKHEVDVGDQMPGPTDLDVERGWLGGGYGHATSEGERAMRLLDDREGITLEPVYTAKAMAALLALNAEGRFGDGPVLFWHTYGGAG